jgi:hypothetical protein
LSSGCGQAEANLVATGEEMLGLVAKATAALTSWTAAAFD